VIFHSQDDFMAAFHAGDLDRDLIAVIRFQGPKANGMPELHKLTPLLGVLQDRGFKVALLTDGRMSGASGKVPAAIHVTPEAADGGPIARIQAGDLVRLDAMAGRLDALVDADDWAGREPAIADLSENTFGMGREMFAMFRTHAGSAETGACILNHGD
jgi:phosphogluconate dehydratase